MRANSSRMSKLSSNINKHQTKGSQLSAQQPENMFSLVGSEAKFAQLKQKLRRITGGAVINKQNLDKNNQGSQNNQDKVTLKVIESNVTKSKQLKSSLIILPETQRKKRRFDYRLSNQMAEGKSNEKQLLKKKQQALNEINRLLVIKQEYLHQIQHQLRRQSKQLFKKGDSLIQQPPKQTAQKVKAPNLSKIREQKQKQKQKSHIF